MNAFAFRCPNCSDETISFCDYAAADMYMDDQLDAVGVLALLLECTNCRTHFTCVPQAGEQLTFRQEP